MLNYGQQYILPRSPSRLQTLTNPLNARQNELPRRNRRRHLRILHRILTKLLPELAQKPTHQVPKHHAARRIEMREVALGEVVLSRVLQPDSLKVRHAALVEVDVARADGVGGYDGGGDLVGEVELDGAGVVVLAPAEGGDEDLWGVSGGGG